MYQDVRARFISEGKWLEMTPHIPAKNGPEDVDEISDTYDTIEWLLENVTNHNGRVGIWGISCMGFYAAACNFYESDGGFGKQHRLDSRLTADEEKKTGRQKVPFIPRLSIKPKHTETGFNSFFQLLEGDP